MLIIILKMKLLIIPSCSPLCLSGEWQTRFDPLVTSKGVFYLDIQNSVSVDMMKSAQYPLRLLDDPELEAQVTQAFMITSVVPIRSIITSGAKNALKPFTHQCMISFFFFQSSLPGLNKYVGILYLLFSRSCRMIRCPS